jgi:hypothetical protein
MQVILTFSNRSLIYPAAMDTQEVSLTTQSNFDIFFYHKPELLKRLYRSFFLSQSILYLLLSDLCVQLLSFFILQFFIFQ